MNPVSALAFADELSRIKEAATVGQNVVRTVKAFGTPGKSLRKGWVDPSSGKWVWDWHGVKLPGAKTLMVAGSLPTAKAAIKKEDPTGREESRATRTARLAGSLAGGVIGGPHGITGGLLGSVIGEQAGKGLAGVGGAAKRAVLGQSAKRAVPMAEHAAQYPGYPVSEQSVQYPDRRYA